MDEKQVEYQEKTLHAPNGLAVLLKEYAKTVGVSTVQVLAILATVLTVPEMRDGDAGEEK